MTEETLVQDEVQSIKERLDLMGVKYHHNAKLETLRALLDSSLAPKEVNTEVAQRNQARKQLHDEAMALVRCRIACMNPGKKDWVGEIFTTGNSVLGIVRKFIPYNCEAAESYHIPRILLNSMRDRKYLQVRSIKTRSGAIQENVFVPEFQIVELPPLTPDELKELAEAQRNTLKD